MRINIHRGGTQTLTVKNFYYPTTSRARSALVAVVDPSPGATYNPGKFRSLNLELRRNLGIMLFVSAKHGIFLSVALLGTKARPPGPGTESEPGFFDSALAFACQHCKIDINSMPLVFWDRTLN